MPGYDPMIKFKSNDKVSSLSNAEIIFKLIGVDPEKDEELRIFDEYEGLLLIHYLSPGEGFSHVRGVVVDSVEEKVLAGTFPHTEEYESNDPLLKEIKFGNGTATVAYEGTILRVYYCERLGKWFMSTYKKIDGVKSKWSGLTFGESFSELLSLEDLDRFLKRDLCYAFLLSDPSNRMVCILEGKKLYHVGTFTRDVYTPPNETDYIEVPPSVIINSPLDVSSIDEIIETSNSLGWEKATGILIKQENGTFLKVTPPSYLSMKEIRGNEPNLKIRFLELLLVGRSSSLRELFPEKRDYFDDIIDQLDSLVTHLHTLYLYRYVEGNYLKLDKEEWKILNPGMNNGEPIEIIRSRIYSSDALSINRMINRMNKNYYTNPQ